jgi:hypothetical protein
LDTTNQSLAFSLRHENQQQKKTVKLNQSGSKHFGFQFVWAEEDFGSYRNAERCSLLVWLLNSNDIFSCAPQRNKNLTKCKKCKQIKQQTQTRANIIIACIQ